MKKAVVALVTLFCAACASTKSEDWTPVVVPYDQPPAECTRPVLARPRPALKEYSGQGASDQYKKLANSYDDISADYRVCQKWAKGQR